MGKCCICGKEGERLFHGMWWCEEHYKMVKENPERVTKSKSEKNTIAQSSSVDLGLSWV